MLPPRHFALNNPFIAWTAASRCRSRAVSSSTVACFSCPSSRGGAVVQPATRRHRKVMRNARRDGLRFLCQDDIQRFPHFVDPNQFNPVNSFELRQIPFRQKTALKSHLSGFANPQLRLADRADLSAEPDFAQDE